MNREQKNIVDVSFDRRANHHCAVEFPLLSGLRPHIHIVSTRHGAVRRVYAIMQTWGVTADETSRRH